VSPWNSTVYLRGFRPGSARLKLPCDFSPKPVSFCVYEIVFFSFMRTEALLALVHDYPGISAEEETL